MSAWWDKGRHADRKPFLEARARIAAAVRAWFAAEGFTEVEPAALALSPGAEVHVDAYEADGRFLHTSPEFAMKKLLAAGEERIFFLGKCWRRGEIGPLHAEEFTMLEWYRAGAGYQHVMADCVEIARVAAREASGVRRWREKECDPFAEAERLSVRDAFVRYSASPFVGEAPPKAAEGGRADASNVGAFARPPPPAPAPQGGGGDSAHDAFSKAI